MKYLLLLTNTSDTIAEWERATPEERNAMRKPELAKWAAFGNWLEERGIELEGLELDIPATAKTLRRQDGEVLVTDGPFLETKEAIGGYLLVECDDLDGAIEIATRIPVAEKGSVEIRPLVSS